MTTDTLMRARSALIAPGNRPDLVTKFPRYGADIYILDLEDGTPPEHKIDARRGLLALVSELIPRLGRARIGVRVNEPWSPYYLDDLQAVSRLNVDLIVIPKVECAAQLFPAIHCVRSVESLRATGLLLGVESMAGVCELAQLTAGGPEVKGVYFGAEDFASDLGAARTPDSTEVLFARSQVVLHAHRNGLFALDQVVTEVRDEVLFRRDVAFGRSLGYDGKVCLLPSQVAMANELFMPDQLEIDYSMRLLAAALKAGEKGIGTIDFEGKMVDGPLLKRARHVLSQAGIAAPVN